MNGGGEAGRNTEPPVAVYLRELFGIVSHKDKEEKPTEREEGE